MTGIAPDPGSCIGDVVHVTVGPEFFYAHIDLRRK